MTVKHLKNRSQGFSKVLYEVKGERKGKEMIQETV